MKGSGKGHMPDTRDLLDLVKIAAEGDCFRHNSAV